MSPDQQEREISRYTVRGRRALLCGKELSAEFERSIRRELESYLEENPESGQADVLRIFGTPEQAAELFLETIPAEQLRAERRAQTLRFRLMAAGLLALSAASLAAGLWAQFC